MGPIVTSAAGTTTVVTFGANESPPYWSKNLPHGGLCGEILHAMSQEVDLESVIEIRPLKRLIEDDSRNVTGNPLFFIATGAFEAIIPIAVYYSALFYYRPHHEEGIRFTGLADLRGYKIGILKATLVDRPYFDNAGITFEESYTEQSLFKKLEMGRLDMCISIDLVGHLTVQRLFPDEAAHFTAINIPGSVTPIAVMLSKKCPNALELAGKYRKGLRIITENGIYHRILGKYYGKDRIPVNWFHNLNLFRDMYDTK